MDFKDSEELIPTSVVLLLLLLCIGGSKLLADTTDVIAEVLDFSTILNVDVVLLFEATFFPHIALRASTNFVVVGEEHKEFGEFILIFPKLFFVHIV